MAERKNALARAPEIVFRASMLPVGNYEDGSIAFPVRPQGWLDLVDSWRQFTNAAEAARGIPHTAEESFPRQQDVGLATLPMAGSGLGHLGLRAAERAVSGAAPESVAASRALPSRSVEAGSTPVTARVYRGASNAEQWPPQYPEHNVFWASDDPAAASNYTSEALKWGGSKASVTPADVTFDNPMVVDAAGRRWDGFGTEDTNALARRARAQGHDGLIVRNVIDNLTGRGEPATTYAALQPGTVRSATTGETLFSNPKEAAPAGLLATDQKNDSMPQQSDFDRAFSELDAALIDLDGDGVPDVQVPRNALAGAQVPQRLVPRGAQPIQPGFEMLPSEVPQRPMNALAGGGAQPQTNALSPPMNAAERGADEMMPRYRGPVDAPPQQGFVGRNLNALANYTNGIVKDVTDDPWGAAEGALGFFGGYGASSGAARDIMLRPADHTMRGLVQRELRSYTESGARKNGLEQVEINARRAGEARDAFNAHPDVVMSRQPHQQLQGRDPKTGRWQKFTDEVREARDRGVELRRRDQAGTDLAKKWSEGSN